MSIAKYYQLSFWLKELYLMQKSFGVSQGSVLGPILYCLYIKPVSDIIWHYGLVHHLYADNTQICIAIKQDCFADKLSDIEDWVSVIILRMERNIMKLNKTEFIMFKSNCSMKTFAGESIQVGCIAIKIGTKVKNLELYLTSHCLCEHYCQSLLFILEQNS